jgi:hypothetical protein
MRWCRLACVMSICLVACGAQPGLASRTTPAELSPSPPAASPSPSPSPAPGSPVARPATMPVTFTGLSDGSYITHLHSTCSGAQNFHITVLQTLVVHARSGTIEVSSSYFGRGLCVIVYASRNLTSVLTTRRI